MVDLMCTFMFVKYAINYDMLLLIMPFLFRFHVSMWSMIQLKNDMKYSEVMVPF